MNKVLDPFNIADNYKFHNITSHLSPDRDSRYQSLLLPGLIKYESWISE